MLTWSLEAADRGVRFNRMLITRAKTVAVLLGALLAIVSVLLVIVAITAMTDARLPDLFPTW